MAWDERSIEILKSNWKTKTASQIAELIGGVSRNAVIGKANRLNLSAKIKTRSTASMKLLKIQLMIKISKLNGDVEVNLF